MMKHLSFELNQLILSNASAMAVIADDAHSHPMSQAMIESCFGGFYRNFGLFIDGQLQGFIMLHQLFEQADVIDICVSPAMQGKGLGKALLSHAISWLKTTEAEQVQLEVRVSNTSAIALYKQLGFMECGLRADYYQTATGHEDAQLMLLDLCMLAAAPL